MGAGWVADAHVALLGHLLADMARCLMPYLQEHARALMWRKRPGDCVSRIRLLVKHNWLFTTVDQQFRPGVEDMCFGNWIPLENHEEDYFTPCGGECRGFVRSTTARCGLCMQKRAAPIEIPSERITCPRCDRKCARLPGSDHVWCRRELVSLTLGYSVCHTPPRETNPFAPAHLPSESRTEWPGLDELHPLSTKLVRTIAVMYMAGDIRSVDATCARLAPRMAPSLRQLMELHYIEYCIGRVRVESANVEVLQRMLGEYAARYGEPVCQLTRSLSRLLYVTSMLKEMFIVSEDGYSYDYHSELKKLEGV